MNSKFMCRYSKNRNMNSWAFRVDRFEFGGRIEPYQLGFDNGRYRAYPDIAYYPDLINLVLLAALDES